MSNDTPYITSWCGGMEGNKACNYHCKACLILSGKARLVKADDTTHVLTYRYKEENATTITPKEETNHVATN